MRQEAAQLAAARYIVEEDVDVVVQNAAERYDAAVAPLAASPEKSGG